MFREEVLRIARLKGIKELAGALIDYYQDIFLWVIYGVLSENIVLKGGTALYKFYGSPRFSLDLDFDLVGTFDIQEILNSLRRSFAL